MGNKTWSAAINVAGAKERGVAGQYVEPATGAYKVKVTGTELYEKDGRESVQVQTVIVGGEFDGVETRIYLGLDMEKGGNKRSWRGALLSIGFTDAELDAGEITIAAETLNGAEGFIYYVQKNPDDKTSQSERNFITPHQYAQLTADVSPTSPAVNAPAARTVAARTAAPAAAPAAGVPAMNVPQPTGAAARLRGMAAARQQ